MPPTPLDAAFERQAQAYEAMDRNDPPPKGAILLVGDSQFFRWKTFREDLPGYNVINRGIDSLQTSDLIRFSDRLVVPYRPRMIVLHVGGNDVHNGKTAEQLLADFKTFVAKARSAMPGVPIAYTSITPGPGRWDEADRRKAANTLVKSYVATQPGLSFIDLWDAMLTPNGKPREDLWVADRVHPNHAGYMVRAGLMRPLLGEPDRLSLLPNVTLRPDTTIDLWPGIAPGETGKIGTERVVPERPRPFDQITDVTVPTLSVFQPSPGKRTGTGVLLIPGGGLERLAIEHEGYEAAEWLIDHGITAFLLKYRVPARDPAQPWKAGLQDAQRAMGLIRANAEKWKVDADAIGSIGFSAGAQINVMLSAYHAEPRQYAPLDAADTFSTRLDFNIAIYGGGFTDPRTDLLSDDIMKRLGKDTPPMFLVHAFDDQALNSLALMTALKRASVASELHIFGAGGHGFGVRDTGLPLGDWRTQCVNWLAWQGFLDPPPVRAFARDLASAVETGSAALPRLSSTVPEADLDAAYAAQKRIARRNLAQGNEIVGYMSAAPSAKPQGAMSMGQPLHGVLFRRGRIEAAADVSVVLDPKRPIWVEAGIGYVLAVDIGTKLRVARQALTSVEAMVPVINLPANVSAPMGPEATAADLVAANFGADRFIVGAPAAPGALPDPDALTVSLQRGGETLYKARADDRALGQAAMLMTLINQIIDEGHVIHRGDIILSVPIGRATAGEKGRYTADFGSLGVVRFELK